MAVKFGVFVPQGWKMDLVGIADPAEQYETMTGVARVAEEVGFDSIWVYDHMHTVPTVERETTFECWSIMAGLARDTSRVRLGQMCTCNGYRNPSMLAKITSTVDVMSHGRVILGFGAGWHEHEWRAYGFGFPDTPRRMGMFREACEIVHRMLSEDEPVFHGKYYSIDAPVNEPKGAQTPHTPLWIAGGGEQVTLKLVAKWGDGCNIGGTPDVIRHKLEVLERHCDDLGRDYDEIVKSSNTIVHLIAPGEDPEKATAKARGKNDFATYTKGVTVGTPEQIVEQLQEKVNAGINYLIVYLQGVAYDQTPVEMLAREVMPHVRG
jgi:F420-dependent oxidoreductase-like protein